MEIIHDNIFCPKLNQDKIFSVDSRIISSVNTNFYEKKGEVILEKVRDIESLKRVNCKLIAYIDIEYVFTIPTKIKVRMTISDALIIKRGVVSPKNLGKNFIPLTEVTLGSDDEE